MKNLLLITCLLLPTATQAQQKPLDRYSFQREVIVQTKGVTVVRRSTFTYNDKLELVETKISQSKELKLDWLHLCNAAIKSATQAGQVFNATCLNDGTLWGDNRTRTIVWTGLDEEFGSRWFPTLVRSEAKGFKLTIHYYNYKLFRTSVVIRDDIDQ